MDTPVAGSTLTRENGHMSTLKVKPTDTPSMAVTVSAGTAWFGTEIVEFDGGTSPTITAPASGYNWFYVCLRNVSDIVILTGTAHATAPIVPTVPDDTLPLAAIYVASTDTIITKTMIYDIRPIFTSPEVTTTSTGVAAHASDHITGGTDAIQSATSLQDGLMTSTYAAKLDGIEDSATADMTGSEIKAAYESESDTNAFTDAEKTKLAGIESSATADMTGSEIKAAYELETNAFTDTLYTKLDGIESGATADMTAVEIKTAYESNADTNAFTDADSTKLSGIEANATADQTGAEIKSLYELEANAFTDTLYTKLDGIETGATADMTGSEIKAAYENEADTNAFTDTEKTKLAGVADGATSFNISTTIDTVQPTLLADGDMAIWINSGDSNRVYLVYRRGSGDQVSIELT